jgi:uncharacterized protein with PQ loop repeat
MDFETLVGVGASVFTATSLTPQLIKLLKENNSKDISVIMLVVLFTGLAVWVWFFEGSLDHHLKPVCVGDQLNNWNFNRSL